MPEIIPIEEWTPDREHDETEGLYTVLGPGGVKVKRWELYAPVLDKWGELFARDYVEMKSSLYRVRRMKGDEVTYFVGRDYPG